MNKTEGKENWILPYREADQHGREQRNGDVERHRRLSQQMTQLRDEIARARDRIIQNRDENNECLQECCKLLRNNHDENNEENHGISQNDFHKTSERGTTIIMRKTTASHITIFTILLQITKE